MTAIPPQTTGRLSGGFMEATEDTEGIMENTGNGSTLSHVLKGKESS